MTNGISATVAELIALAQYAKRVRYQPEGFARRVGNHLSILRGRGMDFSELRGYQAGDEIRHMEWRVTARTGKPHVKLYQEERERALVLFVDFNPSMVFGTRVAFKSVVAARLAALIAWTAMKQGDRVGGLLADAVTHHEFMPKAREAAVLPFLSRLSAYTEKPMSDLSARPLSEALLRLYRVVRPGSTIVLISDFYDLDAAADEHISRLMQHNNVLLYHIVDPLELAAPKPAAYAMTDGRRDMMIDTRRESVRHAYEAYCQTRLERVQAWCHRFQIQCVQVTALDDLPMLVWRSFPRRHHG